MTFFNKKTEVMEIEMTPYGRYLYSIGKFKPHSYEFVDDDILYKAKDSTETQEEAHPRILNETPKLKTNRAFRDEQRIQTGQVQIGNKIELQTKMNKRQSDPKALGRSSYNSDNSPSIQVQMLQGEIKDSTLEHDGTSQSRQGIVRIPQVDVDFNISATIKNELLEPSNGKEFTSPVDSEGRYVELTFESTIILLKEFGSFYEKENFNVEVFIDPNRRETNGALEPLLFNFNPSLVQEDILIDNDGNYGPGERTSFEEGRDNKEFASFYLSLRIDDEIPDEDICATGRKLEINNRFLDREIVCPDQRTDRFDIYSTRVSPGDLEDCD